MTGRTAMELAAASVISLWVSVACSQDDVSVAELLERMRTDIYAEGVSFRVTAREYQSATVEEWTPALYSQTTFLTDGERRRIDTRSSPADFGPKPEFAVTTSELFDGEIYKKLRLGDESRTFSSGTIKSTDSTLTSAERILVGLFYLSAANENLLESTVLRDDENDYYGIRTIVENDGQVILWVDPARGYRVVSKEHRIRGEPTHRTDVELAESEGHWVPARVVEYDVHAGVPTIMRAREIVSIDRGPEIGPETFQLNFPKGVRVTDLR